MRRQVVGLEKKALPVSEIQAEQIVILSWTRSMQALFQGRECTLSQRDKAVTVAS